MAAAARLRLQSAAVAALLLALAAAAAAAGASTVYLVGVYCPTDFTSRGYVAAVDVATGAAQLRSTFKLTDDFEGCAIEEDPIVTLDHHSGALFLAFQDYSGLILQLDVAHAKLERVVRPTDPFFIGFDSYAYTETLGLGTFLGYQPTVTESGLCDDGCFNFGKLSTAGKYTNVTNIPFKALMDDSFVYVKETDLYYAQASYDLREDGQRCAPADSDLCLVVLDVAHKAMTSTTYTSYTVYKFGKPDSAGAVVPVFAFDYALCKNVSTQLNDYTFGTVDLRTAALTAHSCVPNGTVVDMDEWIGDFSLDGSIYATGSGDAEAGEAQLIAFDTASAKPVLNTKLADLKQQLQAAEGLFDVWAVAFLD